MRARLRGLGVAVVVLLGCASAGPHRLADRLPAELPDALTLAGWHRFAGRADMGDSATVVYELYVNPVRPALYEITRYRVTRTTEDGEGRRSAREETEKVLWNPVSTTRQPLRCFEWVGTRSWRTLWLADKGEWRRIAPATPAYDSEMRKAIRVYALHNERRAAS